MQPQNQPLVLPLPFPSSSSLLPTRELSSSFAVSSPSSVQRQFDPNPRKKKRSKTMAVNVDDPEKPRPRKPDPNAPKITRPCTECGKRFWSWKALFGHMRCHPERQWRGINPPPNLRSPSLRPAPVSAVGLTETENSYRVWAVMTEEDHEVAECLLKLADGPADAVIRGGGGIIFVRRTTGPHEEGCAGPTTCQHFECSSCKKVFGSHQALGGHRASHKNVKGCFAMTRSGDRNEDAFLGTEVPSEGAATTTFTGITAGHHQCGKCNRVFPSGQALGGHKRCHWEKGEEEEVEVGGQFFCLDLNQPPAPPTTDEDSSSSSRLSDLTLDLRLAL